GVKRMNCDALVFPSVVLKTGSNHVTPSTLAYNSKPATMPSVDGSCRAQYVKPKIGRSCPSSITTSWGCVTPDSLCQWVAKLSSKMNSGGFSTSALLTAITLQ